MDWPYVSVHHLRDLGAGDWAAIFESKPSTPDEPTRRSPKPVSRDMGFSLLHAFLQHHHLLLQQHHHHRRHHRHHNHHVCATLSCCSLFCFGAQGLVRNARLLSCNIKEAPLLLLSFQTRVYRVPEVSQAT